MTEFVESAAEARSAPASPPPCRRARPRRA